MFRVLALLVASLFGISVDAADESNPLGLSLYGSFLHTEQVPNALFFFSDIEENDSFELRKAIRNHNIDTVVLSSRGGSVWEGLSMAGIIFDKGLKTYIPKYGIGDDGNCASACSYMFFGGRTRVADGKLGVHQFFSDSAKQSAEIGETQSNAQFTVSEIIGFLNEFSTPPFVFERMFQQQEMYYFTAAELKEIARIDEPITSTDIAEIESFIKGFVAELEQLKKEEQKEAPDSQKQETIGPKPQAVEITDVNERQIIKDIQTQLNRLNCSAGIADGIIGARTKAALKRYGKAVGSKLDDALLLEPQFLDELQKANIRCKSVAATHLTCNKIETVKKDEVLGVNRITINDFFRRKYGSIHKITFCTESGCVSEKHQYQIGPSFRPVQTESGHHFVNLSYPYGEYYKEESETSDPEELYTFNRNVEGTFFGGRPRSVFMFSKCKRF